jgi:Polysaccharide deacetylase.
MHFYIMNGRRWKNMATIILTALVTAWFMYIHNIGFPVLKTESGPKAFYKGKNGVALTFDIAWGDEKAEPIIDQLTKLNVKKATFFLSGSWAERHPHIVEKIDKAGFSIGLLGYEYVDYEELDEAQIRNDIMRAAEVFKKLDVKHEKLVRAPNGNFDDRFVKIADQLGYTAVHYSVNTDDWKNPGTKKIVAKAKKAENGDIILLHASDSALQTASALPFIIQELKKKNLEFMTIPEMIIDGKANTSEVH